MGRRSCQRKRTTGLGRKLPTPATSAQRVSRLESCAQIPATPACLPEIWLSARAVASLSYNSRPAGLGHKRLIRIGERSPVTAGDDLIGRNPAPGRSLRQRRLEALRGQGRAAQAHAGRVEDGVGDGGGDRADRALAGAGRWQVGAVQQHDVDRFGRLGDVEDRVRKLIGAGGLERRSNIR
jgi:hypothetical protein